VSAAIVIFAYGYNLGDIRTLGLNWTTNRHTFGEDADERLLRADALPATPHVSLKPHGFEEEPHWLLVTECSTATAMTVLKLGDHPSGPRPADDAALHAALNALGLRAELPPSWLACTYQ
jgi:hypothetical protein